MVCRKHVQGHLTSESAYIGLPDPPAPPLRAPTESPLTRQRARARGRDRGARGRRSPSLRGRPLTTGSQKGKNLERDAHAYQGYSTRPADRRARDHYVHALRACHRFP